MYFSEFTLKLIEEVKKREVLYNTKYDKRPKPEKEEAWRDIGASLDVEADKCKKHWKNVRDRFVKVSHQRDRHFFQGGSELDAPQYIYFEKLAFMREFSIRKDPPIEQFHDILITTDISPEHLVCEEVKDPDGTITFVDYTEQFIELVKEFPVLYDANAEMRKYRAKDAWKQISDHLSGKFTIGKLRQYWTTMMKKYKLYHECPQRCRPIENECIFDHLTFTNDGIHLKTELLGSNSRPLSNQYILQLADDINNSSREYLEDMDGEEHLLCEEVDDSIKGSDDEESEVQELMELTQGDENEEISEPESKKIRLDPPLNLYDTVTPPSLYPIKQLVVADELVSPTIPAVPQQPVQKSFLTPMQLPVEDEFDYFGKKVALQLRDLAQKSRSAARKGEIKVLQLLMELEESLES